MSILKVARMGHPVLRQKAAAVPPKEVASAEVRRLIDDMTATMAEYAGVGLAAPQVHVSRRVIIADSGGTRGAKGGPMALVNPEITARSKATEEDWEGCLSIPDVRGLVPRAAEIEVKALNAEGKAVELSAKGFFARVIQHEVDHLDGVLFLDRMKDLSSLTFIEEFARYGVKRGDA